MTNILKFKIYTFKFDIIFNTKWDCHSCHSVVVGYTSAISARHFSSCEFDSQPWRGLLSIQPYLIKFVSD